MTNTERAIDYVQRDTIGRVTSGTTNPRDRSLRPTRKGDVQVVLARRALALYRSVHGLHRLNRSAPVTNRFSSTRGVPSEFAASCSIVLFFV